MKSKILVKEHGQALVLIAIAAIVLFGFMALAIDGSAKFSDRRNAQNAADTAALAAALAKVNAQTSGLSDSPATCPPSSGSPSAVCAALLTAGLDRASSNNYNNDLVTNMVEVYSPPVSGYYSGNTAYVQVIITSHVKTYFAKVLGFSETVNTVQAVALTKQGGPLFNGASVVSLDPSPTCGNGSVKVSGSGTVTLNGGGLFVNSSVSCGFKEPNCTNFAINGAGISSAGSPIDLHACHGTTISTSTSASQFSIPDDIFIPDKPSVCSTHTPLGSYSKSGNNVTVNPGYYTSFPPITKNSYIITMTAGVYCIDGSVHWTNGSFASLTGSNITFYITAGNEFDMSGGVLNLSAPTSGTYSGYLIILDGNKNSIQTCSINGGADGTVTGTIFSPFCNITINGSSGTNSFSAQVIGYDVTLNGDNTLNLTYDPGKNGKNPRRVGLMK